MKAAKFFSICEIVCFVGLALSYIGYASQSLEALSRYFVPGVFLFSMLILLLSICNLDCGSACEETTERPCNSFSNLEIGCGHEADCHSDVSCKFPLRHDLRRIFGDFCVYRTNRADGNSGCLVCMMASSGYCIALILHARRQGAIGMGTAVRQVISQFIYVVDVISLFFIRKTVKECENGTISSKKEYYHAV